MSGYHKRPEMGNIEMALDFFPEIFKMNKNGKVYFLPVFLIPDLFVPFSNFLKEHMRKTEKGKN